MMNTFKLTSPDFIPRKTVILLKAVLDILFILVRTPSKQSLKLARLILRVKPGYTMVPSNKLINLYNLVQKVDSLGLRGDIVECGVWNGGSAAVMGVACIDNKNPHGRTMWLFDSFEGLPQPGERDGSKEKKGYFEGYCRGDVQNVHRIFVKLGIPLDRARVIRGWFESTLKTAPVKRIAILHIDADWYDSVKLVLETFYDTVVPGGFVILDDYGTWQGCNRAFADFVAERRIEGISLKNVRPSGAYFQKPAQQRC
jgi:O-methyltransferase